MLLPSCKKIETLVSGRQGSVFSRRRQNGSAAFMISNTSTRAISGREKAPKDLMCPPLRSSLTAMLIGGAG